MILVDSSVWIAYFRDTDRALSDELESVLLNSCTCGIVMQEVLQGVKDDKEYRLIGDRFKWLPYYDASLSTYISAADIYRSLRKKGKTIVTMDALIASIAIENRLELFTLDATHFDMIKESFKELNLYARSSHA